MSIRRLLTIAAAAALLTVVAIWLIDAPVARALGPAAAKSGLARTFAEILEVLDRVTFMTWPRKEQLAIVLIVLGALLWWWRPAVGHAVLLVGLTHALSRTLGGYLKPMFGRLRPGEALAAGHVDDSFFRDGISFPSGHIAHYAVLALAVAYLWPRLTVPAAVVVAVVITARVSANAHFVSDVTGSIAVAALAVALVGAALGHLRTRGRRR